MPALRSALVLLLVLAAPAAALQAPPLPEPPMVLPGHASRAVESARWIVGARPRPPAGAIAARFGARPLGGGAFAVAVGEATGLARALRARHLLFYAQPDVARRRASAFEAAPDAWARGAVVPSTLVPPPPTAAPIAVIDDFVDATLPDLAGHVTYLNRTKNSVIQGPHGTMVASAASAAANGQGILGVLPGNTILSWGVPTEFTCADSTPAIYAAIRAGARVINLSYGSPSPCFPEYVALQVALGRRILVVAAAGNEFAAGNPVSYPAALPHVLSVAALNRNLTTAYFSTANAAVDVAAPGADVPLDIPLPFDTEDGTKDGLTTADGTSFSSPIAAGAAAWVLAARPGLSGAQAADLLRRTATDVAAKGYDVNTGFGLINIPRALAAPAPARDPLEPNDGFEWVDGRAFSKPDPFVWEGYGSRSLVASVDEVEDPLDVYRFRLAPHSRARIAVRAISGDPRILVYRSGTTSLSQRRRILSASSHPGNRTEVVHLANHSPRPRSAFAVVLNDTSAHVLDARYRLSFMRVAG